jgi:hypothetical protein
MCTARHEAGFSLSQCLDMLNEHPGRVADVCIWQDIEFWLRSSDSLVCLVRKGGVVQHRAGARAQHSPASGTERRAAEWNQSRICADFGHAVSLCRMIRLCAFGAFDQGQQPGGSQHWVKASSSRRTFPVCSKWAPLSRAKWPFLKRIMRAAQADVHRLRFLWPVSGP